MNNLERVFKIQTTMMDMEFDELKSLMLHVAINTTMAQEQVGEIECKISNQWKGKGKDDMLPYHKMPKLMVIELTSHLQEARQPRSQLCHGFPQQAIEEWYYQELREGHPWYHDTNEKMLSLSTNNTIPSRDANPHSNASSSPGERRIRRRMSTNRPWCLSVSWIDNNSILS